MKNVMTGTYIKGEETFNFNFATDLSASEKITFVNSVVDTVVGGNYYSLVRDIMFNHMVIQLFTDVGEFYFKDASDKIDAIEEFLEETNIADIVKVNMETGLLGQLENAVDKAIEYRTGIHSSPIADSLASLFSTLERKVEEIDLGGAMEMVQKFVGMTGEFTPESVVNAYMNSDIHKNNLDEIAESKKNEIKIDENLGEAVRTVVEENESEKIEDDEG